MDDEIGELTEEDDVTADRCAWVIDAETGMRLMEGNKELIPCQCHWFVLLQWTWSQSLSKV